MPNNHTWSRLIERLNVRTAVEPLSESSHEERVQQLDEALNRLPVEMREILVLREIEEWSYEQMASALNVPSGTVMPRLGRPRQRLKQELAGVRQRDSNDRKFSLGNKSHMGPLL